MLINSRDSIIAINGIGKTRYPKMFSTLFPPSSVKDVKESENGKNKAVRLLIMNISKSYGMIIILPCTVQNVSSSISRFLIVL